MQHIQITALVSQIEQAIETTKSDPNATFIQKIWKARGQEAVLEQVKGFFNVK